MNNLRIELYNRLTDINGIENNENFLCSIEYKPSIGNILLNALEKIQNLGYNFSIIKGFIGEKFEINDEYNTFKKCIIKFENENININNFGHLFNGLNITILKKGTFEIKINER